MPGIGFALFISLFFAVGFGVIASGIYNLRASRIAKRWPTTEGKITHCQIKKSSDSESTTYRAEVRYSYAVGGAEYKGDRVAFGYSGDGGRQAHQQIVDRLSRANTVLVRYDPANPSQSVLSCGVNRSTILLLVFGTTWLLFVTGFTIVWCMSKGSDNGILNTLIVTR